MNWAYPLPWDVEGHLRLFIGGLFWMVIWIILYAVLVGLRACWRGLRNLARGTTDHTSAQDRPPRS